MSNKSKAGRPKIEIDWKLFDKLCHRQCTLEEIADFFDCSEDTIQRRVKEKFGVNFAAYYKKASVEGKMSLRRAQMKVALSGNVTMLIWLGKQYLGQSDKQEIAANTQNEHRFPKLTPEEAENMRKAFDREF